MKKRVSTLVLTLMLMVALCVPLIAVTPSVSAQPSYEIIEGTLPDGTSWGLATPEQLELWNGTLVLDLDAVSWPPFPRSFGEWLVSEGYAYGGTSRDGHGFEVRGKCVPNLVEVRQLFINHYGQIPERTISYGLSLGSVTARLAIQDYPDIFDGALVTAAGGSGMVALMNQHLDGQWVLKTLVNPESPFRIVGVEIPPIEQSNLQDLVDLADSTPEGRARLALAGAVRQFPVWAVPGTPESAPDDYDAQYEQLLQEFPSSPAGRVLEMEVFSGGVLSWNNDVNYTVMLARSGRQDFVMAMYDKAGLGRKGLMEDLRTLSEAPRIYADPEAVDKAEKEFSYTGEVGGPVMCVDTIGDGDDSSSNKLAYQDTLRRAGNNKLFQMAWVHRTGHAQVSLLELATAFTILINRLDTGKWGDTSASAMNALANQVRSQTDLIPETEESTFMEYRVPTLLRPWDGSNWDSYQP